MRNSAGVCKYMKTEEIDFRKVLEESEAEIKRLTHGEEAGETCDALEKAEYGVQIAENFIEEYGQNGNIPVVVIKKFNLREATEIEDEITDIQVVGRKQTTKVKTGLLQLVSLEKGIVSAPFEITRSVIGELDPHLGKFLYDKLDELNTLSLKKSKVSGSHSSTERPT